MVGPPYDAVAAVLRPMCHKHRFVILCELLHGERTVGELTAAVALRQPSVSQHLAYLRLHKLVRASRRGQRVYYSLRDDLIERIVGSLHVIYCRAHAHESSDEPTQQVGAGAGAMSAVSQTRESGSASRGVSAQPELGGAPARDVGPTASRRPTAQPQGDALRTIQAISCRSVPVRGQCYHASGAHRVATAAPSRRVSRDLKLGGVWSSARTSLHPESRCPAMGATRISPGRKRAHGGW